jgi:hypothetical protein
MSCMGAKILATSFKKALKWRPLCGQVVSFVASDFSETLVALIPCMGCLIVHLQAEGSRPTPENITVLLENQDHTLGNSLRYVLMRRCDGLLRLFSCISYEYWYTLSCLLLVADLT